MKPYTAIFSQLCHPELGLQSATIFSGKALIYADNAKQAEILARSQVDSPMLIEIREGDHRAGKA